MMIKQKCARILHNKKGQALIETALSIFILFLLVFGIVEFGRAMFVKNMLNNAARAGARTAVVSPPTGSGNPPKWGASDISTITNSVNNAVYYTKAPEQVNVTILIRTPPSTTDTTVTANTVHPSSGDIVTVQTQLTNFVSIVPKLIPISATLTGTASMRYE